MASRKTTHPETFEAVYKRLEEVMLANSGENEFEEIFKLVVLKLWKELVNKDFRIKTVSDANEALVEIDQLWSGVLLETDFNITDEQFQVCKNIIEEMDFSSEDYEEIDAIFEFLISREKKGSKGQFFTPRYIVDFCVKILNPRSGETILDPACGSGAFLYHSYMNGLSDGSGLWGFDFDSTAVRVARLLMHVGGVSEFHIYKVNSLVKSGIQISLPIEMGFSDVSLAIEDILKTEKFKGLFDVVITNPPFAGEIIEPDILSNYEVVFGKSRIERDIVFIERCIGLLNPNGRMAIVLPDNVFGGKETEQLRKWIYERCRIVGVVGIPRNAFMPHTPVKTSILFLEKRKAKRDGSENVFFAISENPGKDSRGKLLYKNPDDTSWKNVDHDLRDIIPQFQAFLKQEKVGW